MSRSGTRRLARVLAGSSAVRIDLHAPARESRVDGVRRRRHGRRGRTGHQLAMRQDAQIVQVVPVRVRKLRGFWALDVWTGGCARGRMEASS